MTGARGKVKVFTDKCQECQARDLCDGIDPHYLDTHGSGEFRPYTYYQDAPMATERRTYIPPFAIKTSQFADMKSANRQLCQKTERNASATRTNVGPRVTVVIPCYNYGRFLKDAVQSVLNQTFQDHEIVIVNDGSTDDSKQLAEEIAKVNSDRRIRVLDQPNAGQPAIARNNGIAQSQAEYIMCLDADDMIEPTMLEECIKVLDDTPQIAIAYTDLRSIGALSGISAASDYNFEALRYANHINCCNVFRRKAWVEAGGYRTNCKGVEDWDFWIALGALGYYGKRIPRPLFKYRRHGNSLTTEVRANFEKKAAQVLLNNVSVYPPDHVRTAERVLKEANAPQNVRLWPASGYRPEFTHIGLVVSGNPSVTQQTIEALHAETYGTFALTVIDNATDEPTQRLQNDLRATGQIKNLVRLEKSTDAATAYNLAWQMEPEAASFVRLENGAIVTNRHWLNLLILVAKQAPSAGVVAYSFEEQTYRTVGTVSGVPVQAKGDGGLVPGCLIIPKSLHGCVGTFNEDAGQSSQELEDYCSRVRDAKRLTLYLSSSGFVKMLPEAVDGRVRKSDSPTDTELRRIDRLVREGRELEAMSCLEELLAKKPDEPRAHNALAVLYWWGAMQAMEHLRRAVELHPDYEIAWRNFADLYVEMGRWDEARAALEQVLRLCPGDAEASATVAELPAQPRQDRAPTTQVAPLATGDSNGFS